MDSRSFEVKKRKRSTMRIRFEVDLMPKPKIIFVSANLSSFIRQDLDLLSKHYDVRQFAFGSRKGFSMLLHQMRLLFWLLAKLWNAKAVFVWFADYHSFLPSLLGRMFGKKVFIVIGGYDAVAIPEFNYGGHNSKLRSWMIRKSIRWASQIFPVSHTVERRLFETLGISKMDKSQVVFNGIDLAVFAGQTEGLEKDFEKRKGIICVSSAESITRAKIKGLDFLMEVGKAMPDVPITVVGMKGEALQWMEQNKTANIQLVGWIKREDLGALFRQTKVICQFSRFESFGLAVAEGMLMGCIPVSFEGIGPAEIITPECGYVVPAMQLDAATQALRQALHAPLGMAIKSSEKIQKEINLEVRGAKLMRLMGLG
jgi:glycosyltransferase involved in cell wall biosynthesis